LTNRVFKCDDGEEKELGQKGPIKQKEISMKYKVRQIIVVMVLFFSMGLLRSQDWLQESNEYGFVAEETGGRSYHGATYDMVTGAEHSPFMFTTSSLGQSLRATSFLLGHLYEAAEDASVCRQMMEEMDSFCEKILNLYVLSHEALRSVERQLHDTPEKTGYLMEEVEHLRQRMVILSECFSSLVDTAQSHEISTVLVTLNILINKTGQMLAL